MEEQIFQKFDAECDLMNWDKNTSPVYSKIEQQSNLPLIREVNTDRLQELQKQMCIHNIGIEIKVLNAYKNLQKVKWYYTTNERFVDGLIFNDKTASLKHVRFEKSDTSIPEKLWQEMSSAVKTSV